MIYTVQDKNFQNNDFYKLSVFETYSDAQEWKIKLDKHIPNTYKIFGLRESFIRAKISHNFYVLHNEQPMKLVKLEYNWSDVFSVIDSKEEVAVFHVYDESTANTRYVQSDEKWTRVTINSSDSVLVPICEPFNDKQAQETTLKLIRAVINNKNAECVGDLDYCYDILTKDLNLGNNYSIDERDLVIRIIDNYVVLFNVSKGSFVIPIKDELMGAVILNNDFIRYGVFSDHDEVPF